MFKDLIAHELLTT